MYFSGATVWRRNDTTGLTDAVPHGWQARRCFTVTHSSPGDPYFITTHWCAPSLHVHAAYASCSMQQSMIDVQAIAIASIYAAAKIVELSGSGVPGFREDPFPDWDRGNAAVLIKSAVRWLHRRYHEQNNLSNGKSHTHVHVRRLSLASPTPFQVQHQD
jgi:hypothetical protein